LAGLFDTSIYIAALRQGENAVPALRWSGKSPVWLSSVVLEELPAGANSRQIPLLEKIERDFDRVGRIVTPNHGDWVRAGRVLARIGQKYGYEEIGKAWLTNDSLIATSSARLGITVITANKRDFERLTEICSLQWQAQAV
jgi:predicted nucleic acid-binding protein